jgi:predicted MFS family arabinose efflux permease
VASATSPLRANRDFQLLWSGQAVSVAGTAISAIAYPLVALSLTGSPAAAGIVGFVGRMPYLLFQLPAGAIADRVDRRRLMIGCDAGRLAALGSVPVALWLGHLTLVQLTVVAFVEGSLFVFFRLGEVAAVRLVVPPAQYPQALSQNEGRIRAANLLGTPVGGFLFDLGMAVPFLADACSYLVSLATLLLIRRRFQEERLEGERRPVLAEVREGVEWLWGQRFVFVTVLVAAASNLLFQALVLALVVLVRSRGGSGALTGMVLAGFGVGGVLGALSGAWFQRRLPASAIVVGAVWIWAALTPLVVVVPTPVLPALLAAEAFAGATWNVALNTYYLRLVPDRLVARVSSVGSLASFGALPLGSLAGGLLLQAGGPVVCCSVLAAGMVVLAAIATLSPSVRHGPPLSAARDESHREQGQPDARDL